MAVKPENFGGVGPKEGGELLSLLLQFGRMPESSAVKDLGVGRDVVREWEKALADEGWIKRPDPLLSDPLLELSPEYDKKLSLIREQARRPVESKSAAGKLVPAKSTTPKMSPLFAYDMTVLISLALSVYLILKFAKNPQAGFSSAIAGVVLFAVSMSVLRAHRRVSQAKSGKGLAQSTPSLFAEVVSRRKRYIVVVAMVLAIIFLVGRFLVSRNPENMLLLIIPLSTIPLVFLRRVKAGFIVRYYIGMILLMYSLLLLTGFYSVSAILVGSESRAVDVLVSFVIIGLIQLSEKYFGVGVSFVFEWARTQKKPVQK